ncbi:glycerol-3-phosphate dehydrogenase/oxidase [Arenibacterium sp. CAU 1754]
MRSRADLLDRLRTGSPPEVLIIGGGINGVGVFRDLAAQGVPALLVDAGDFSSGTSAAPSRLIHGGLRYLETGETGLVREALLERNLLLKNACHIVHPQPVWIPLRSWFGGALSSVLRFLKLKKTPGRKGAVPVAMGLSVYDLFSRAHRTMPTHRVLSAARAKQEMPALAGDIKAVAEFYDARISHPERLVLELVADAETDCEAAMAIPYLAAGANNAGCITLHDKLSNETFSVTPRIVINAAGAWVDRVQGDLGIPGRLMGGTRGTHLVMRNSDLAKDLGGRMLYFETHDFRACLTLPLDADHVYVGTTDIRVDDPDDRHFSEEEIDYIFDVLRPVLPGVDWRREDSVFTMAGIRPLPFQDGSVKATGAISRDHRIERFAPAEDRPFETLTLVGGKWTTYRAFAEQVTDLAIGLLDHARRTDTRTLAIGGARGFPCDETERARWLRELAARTGLDMERCAVLAGRYGVAAEAFVFEERRENRALSVVQGYSLAEIERICQHERVNRLDDIVMRRTLMAFEGQTSLPALEEVADIAAQALGWDAAERSMQLEATIKALRANHRVDIA